MLSSTRAAFAPVAPLCRALPTFVAPMRPSDSLVPVSYLLRSSLAGGVARSRTLVLCEAPSSSAGPLCARATSDASEIGHRVSVAPVLSRERQGPPRCLGSPSSHAPWSAHPAGFACPAHTGFGDVVFAVRRPMDTRIIDVFVAASPMAHVFACLRIAGHVAVPVARLTTGWCGSHLAGRDSHPPDDISEFQDFIAFFHPF